MPSYGCLPDGRDDRDRRFGAAAPDRLALPSSHSLLDWLPPPMDQGPYGTCTAHGATSAWRYNLIVNDLPDLPLSRAQLYWDSGVIGGDTGDVGRQIRDVVKCLATTGAAREDLWGYDKVGVEPPPEVRADAANQTAAEYQRVDVDRGEINAAIFVGHPVIVGVAVFPAFEGDEVAATGVVPMPGPRETPVGLHCMLMGAYDPAYDTLLNSWGTWFGLPERKGFCRFPRGYLERYGSDFWTIFINSKRRTS